MYQCVIRINGKVIANLEDQTDKVISHVKGKGGIHGKGRTLGKGRIKRRR